MLLRTSLISCLTAVVIVLQGCGETIKATETRTHSLEYVDGMSVHVLSKNGAVEIIGDPAATDINIQAKISAGGASVQDAEDRLAATTLSLVRDVDGTLIVEPKFPTPRRSGDGASFVIRLPDAHGADIATSNGSVNVAHLSGNLVVNTSNGRIVVNDHDGPAQLDTSNGRIEVHGLNGDLHADTSNGSVTAEDVDGQVTIETSNGGITLALGPDQQGPIVLDTSNGNVSVSVGGAFLGTIEFDTSNGSTSVVDRGGRVVSQSINKGDGYVRIGEQQSDVHSIVDTSNGNITITVDG